MRTFVTGERSTLPVRRAATSVLNRPSHARRAEVRQILHGPRLQPRVVQRKPGSCAWPPKYSMVAPTYYSRLSTRLVKVLKESFDGHSPTNKYLDNAFWGFKKSNACSWPKSLWAGLDKFDVSALNALTQVFERADAIRGLWGHVERIKGTWWSSSRGFKIVANQSALSAFLDKSGKFCKDHPLGSSMHPGQTCWREIGRAFLPGLHVCLGGSDHDIHIDPTQVTKAAPDIFGFCQYDLAAVVLHHADLAAGKPTSMLERLAMERKNIETIKRVKLTNHRCGPDVGKELRGEADGLIKRLSDPKIRELAVRGSAGILKAERLLEFTRKRRDRILTRASAQCK